MTTITLEIPDHLADRVAEIGDQLAIVLEMGLSRFAPVSTQAYMETVSLFSQSPTPAEIVAFRFSAEIEARISQLLQENRMGELTQAEEIELDRLSQLEEQLQLVKANALISLTNN